MSKQRFLSFKLIINHSRHPLMNKSYYLLKVPSHSLASSVTKVFQLQLTRSDMKEYTMGTD